jgi:apolipoprotein N-acyltransferase
MSSEKEGGNRFQHYFLGLCIAILAGILIGVAWPPNPFAPLVIVGICLLLYLRNYQQKQGLNDVWFWIYVFVALGIWNGIVLWWLPNTTFYPGILAIFISSLLLSLPFIAYHYLAKFQNLLWSYISFIGCFILHEYILLQGELAFPYMTLGNSLAMYPEVIQWYEFTGVLGGSLWILSLGCALHAILIKKRLKYIVVGVVGLLFPTCISLMIYYNMDNLRGSLKVHVAHTNIDSQTEKYVWDISKVLEHYLTLPTDEVLRNGDLVVWPESAIPNVEWVDEFNNHPIYFNIQDKYLNAGVNLCLGSIGYGKVFAKDKSRHIYTSSSGIPYKLHTGAYGLKASSNNLSYRSKVKLVPFEERTPYPTIFTFISSKIGSLGGFKFTEGNEENLIFQTNQGIGYVYLICYESLFGDFTRASVNTKTKFIVIGLNESWYRNIYAAKQFMYYSALRAIENRRYIVRSSNDGVSAFIDHKGEIFSSYEDFEPRLISNKIRLNQKRTFYNYFGDYIGIVALILVIISLIKILLLK